MDIAQTVLLEESTSETLRNSSTFSVFPECARDWMVFNHPRHGRYGWCGSNLVALRSDSESEGIDALHKKTDVTSWNIGDTMKQKVSWNRVFTCSYIITVPSTKNHLPRNKDDVHLLIHRLLTTRPVKIWCLQAFECKPLARFVSSMAEKHTINWSQAWFIWGFFTTIITGLMSLELTCSTPSRASNMTYICQRESEPIKKSHPLNAPFVQPQLETKLKETPEGLCVPAPAA